MLLSDSLGQKAKWNVNLFLSFISTRREFQAISIREDLTQIHFYLGDLGEGKVTHEPRLMRCWLLDS